MNRCSELGNQHYIGDLRRHHNPGGELCVDCQKTRVGLLLADAGLQRAVGIPRDLSSELVYAGVVVARMGLHYAPLWLCAIGESKRGTAWKVRAIEVMRSSFCQAEANAAYRLGGARAALAIVGAEKKRYNK